MRVACHALRRMRGLPLNLALGLALCLTQAPGIAGAMDFSDPDWPCIQRKVENLSASLMWPAPVTRVALSPEANDLVEALSLRRVSLEEADAHVRAFVERNKQADGQLLGNIFYGVFDNIAETRQRLIAGIARYSRSQIALSSRIEGARVEMAKLSREKSPDFDRIDKLEEQIDWDERIYRDRSQALTYVCETPVLLEKRAYAIAQMLLKHVPD
ncbi:hypothetical protein SM0020_34892 [Sinorhizobium meliloti CCNWSX0020]|uniref:Uncharacterized protein n=2 Tax=Sinorhizobium TaxID=28105 RepID=H0GBQ3_RHIML|nr:MULTISPECIES: hypothetical protein [Sinorhizobium]EHK73265.1 hypothetical protein SM0020_34892 [Sinorhizobium meliloti CCNWSX0020]RVE89176.1 hypothetical protein CN238_14495 [Sinorhizobium meliloti]RVG67797.1 hypothetical protein CN220_20795 [Sinorhizobium meliloti]RVH25965.1 hypothetical protein CN214_22770 [Sinorhizobium meliloti]RVH38740.1 hypothetical protein CN211_04445 [Sinorhizobium meliloti]